MVPKQIISRAVEHKKEDTVNRIPRNVISNSSNSKMEKQIYLVREAEKRNFFSRGLVDVIFQIVLLQK